MNVSMEGQEQMTATKSPFQRARENNLFIEYLSREGYN